MPSIYTVHVHITCIIIIDQECIWHVTMATQEKWGGIVLLRP